MALHPDNQSGPRYVDPTVIDKYKDASLQRYRKALSKFLAFIQLHNFNPTGPAQWDDLLAEWKSQCKPSKSDFEATVASIEMVLPRLKHKLKWSRAILSAWNITHQTRHTVPMTSAPAKFLGCCMASAGHPRLGAGIVVQSFSGMRPSELVGLAHEDVLLPEDRNIASAEYAVLALGVRHGTKAKRAQTVQISEPEIVALLRWLKRTSSVGDPLLGYTYEQYRRVLQRECERRGLSQIGWSPHSPRSGFASDCIANGLGFPKTMELGRWQSESSCKGYVDITTAASILVTFRLNHLGASMSFCCSRLLSFFDDAGSDLRAVLAAPHAASGSSLLHGGWNVPSIGGGGTELLDAEEAVGHSAATIDPGVGALRGASFQRGRGRAAAAGRHPASAGRSGASRGRGGLSQ